MRKLPDHAWKGGATIRQSGKIHCTWKVERMLYFIPSPFIFTHVNIIISQFVHYSPKILR